MMKLRLLRGFLPRPRPLKIFIRRSMGHSADTSDSSTNQDREAGRNSSKAEHSNPAPIGQFYRFLCRAERIMAWGKLMAQTNRKLSVSLRARHALLNWTREAFRKHGRLKVLLLAMARNQKRRGFAVSYGPTQGALPDAALFRRPHLRERVTGVEYGVPEDEIQCP